MKRLALIKKVTLLSTIFALVVIALGAYTRLVHAGLGCPDWPTCYGHLWAPDSTAEILSANQAFPDAPVDLEKTWPEMTHRYLASTLGLLCIVICFLSIKTRQTVKSFPYRHSVALLAFVILQGMFGMWTVTLKLWPQVVTLHLIGGFTTFSLLLLLYLRLSAIDHHENVKVNRNINNRLNILAVVTLIAVIIQVALGGWTTSNYAAMACPQLPWCSVAQLSFADFSQGFNLLQQIGPNYLGGQLDGGARIAIQAVHRFGALIVLILGLILVIKLHLSHNTRLALVLLLMLAIQISLGVSNIYFKLPLFNAVAHNIGGVLLLAITIVVNVKLANKKLTLT